MGTFDQPLPHHLGMDLMHGLSLLYPSLPLAFGLGQFFDPVANGRCSRVSFDLMICPYFMLAHETPADSSWPQKLHFPLLLQ